MGSGPFGRVHLSLDSQRSFILGHGTQVLVSPVLQCPCLREERQFDPLCPTCQGTGRFYPPGTAYTTTLLLHHESSARTFQETGTWMAGMILATLLPEVRLGERDKVQWVDIKDTFSDEVLTRGLQERVRFSAGVEVLLVADRTQVYRPGVDYVLTPPNTVTWVAGGMAPPLAAQYAIKYAAYPEFLVVNDTPRLRVEHRIAQSQEVILLRLDRLGQE
jgi:hypothetical protein